MELSKIAIGTVQFGLPYGIRNRDKKIPTLEEIQDILICAKKEGISLLDTARLYGKSEEVIGKLDTTGFRIVSKLPPCSASQVGKQIEDSLKKLSRKTLYGYLIHNFRAFQQSPDTYESLLRLKKEGLILHTGFSLYYPEELIYLLEREIEFDLIQIPYSILDRRFEPFFSDLKERGVEIHTRSTFLQGALFYGPEELPQELIELKEQVQSISSLITSWGSSIEGTCLGYVLKNPFVDRVIIGVENVQQLDQNLNKVKELSIDVGLWQELNHINLPVESVLIPSNWSSK